MGISRTLEGTLVAALLVMGCGQKSSVVNAPTPAKKTTGGDASGTVQNDSGLSQDPTAAGGGLCNSKDDCPPAAVDVSATFSPEGALLGFTNEAVDWEFRGVDRNTISPDSQSSTRKVAVLLDKVPVDPAKSTNIATINPDPKAGQAVTDAKIYWMPTSQAKGTLDIILRDMDRCLMNESPDFCNAYVYRDAYDTKMANVPWQIVDKAALQAQAAGQTTGGTTATTTTTAPTTTTTVNVSNPNCGNPSSTGSIAGGLISTVGGLFGGGGGGLLSAAPSLLGGLLNKGGSSPQPTQC